MIDHETAPGRPAEVSHDREAKMQEVLTKYFRTPRDSALDRAFDYVVRHLHDVEKATGGKAVGRLAEGRALVLLGKSGAGKSRALEHAFSARPEFTSPRPGGLSVPLISIAAPSPCTLRQLGNAVLDGLGYRTSRSLPENVVWDVIRQQVKVLGIRFLHIDEIQHLFQVKDPNEIAKVRNTLKNLMQQRDWPMFLIVSGLPEVRALLEQDEQIKRRALFVEFDTLSNAEAHYVRRAIAAFAGSMAGLDTRPLANGDSVERLLAAGSHQLGTCIEIIQDSIRKAYEQNSADLTPHHFAAVYELRFGPELQAAAASNDQPSPARGPKEKEPRDWRDK